MDGFALNKMQFCLIDAQWWQQQFSAVTWWMAHSLW